jgi:hypothetical protein
VVESTRDEREAEGKEEDVAYPNKLEKWKGLPSQSVKALGRKRGRKVPTGSIFQKMLSIFEPCQCLFLNRWGWEEPA